MECISEYEIYYKCGSDFEFSSLDISSHIYKLEYNHTITSLSSMSFYIKLELKMILDIQILVIQQIYILSC